MEVTKTVYCVFLYYHQSDDGSLMGVFSNRSKAEACMEMYRRKDAAHCYWVYGIEEYQLDVNVGGVSF